MKTYNKIVVVILALGVLPGYIVGTEIDDISSELGTLNTGSSSALLSSGASSLNDLIPDFKLSIDPSSVTDDGEIKKLAVSYSPRILDFADIGITIKLEDGKVLEQFNDSGLITEDEETKLNKLISLSDSQEYVVDFSFIGSLFGQKFGRSVGLYQSEFESFLDIGLGSQLDDRRNSLRQQRADLLRQIQSMNSCDQFFTALTNGNRSTVLNELQNAIRSLSSNNPDCENLAIEIAPIDIEYRQFTEDVRSEVAQNLTQLGLFKVVSLIDQQPQLLVSLRHLDRDDLIGPDESSVKLTWEMGLGQGSLNDLTRSSEWRNCLRGGPFCISRIGARIDELLASDPQSTTWRFALNAEWIDRSDHRFANTDPMFAYNMQGESSIKAGAALSAKTWLDNSGEPYVFDIAAEYEDNDADMMNDRAVMTFSGTRNIAKGLGLSLSLVWANRPEFVGDADKDLGVKLGLSWKLAPD